jgi:hypothetical protein
MNALNPSLPELYYVSNFISGFREDIKPMLKIHRLITLTQIFEQVKWQEESNNAIAKKTLYHGSTTRSTTTKDF